MLQYDAVVAGQETHSFPRFLASARSLTTALIPDQCSGSRALAASLTELCMLRMRHRPPASFRHMDIPMSGTVLLGGINPEIVGVPQEVAEAAHVPRPHVIVQFGSKLEVTLAQITHDVSSSPCCV